MILAKFRHKYPQGSLVGELIKIDRGTYIVKASVRVDSIILATGLAGAATVEAAEDAARERAISTLFLGESIDTAHTNSSVQTEQNAALASSSASPISDPSNVNFSKPQPQPVEREQPLTPVTVPLKPVVETTESTPSQANPTVSSEPASTNSLFGDTFTAETPIEPVIEDNSNSFMSEANESEEEAMDFNEIKQKTDIEIKRLSWTKDQGKEFLMKRYGKRSRLHLTDEQLLEFLRYLETLPTPVK